MNKNPYLYFLMMKNMNDLLQLPNMPSYKINNFMKHKFPKSKYREKGCIEYHNENYIFYEMELIDEEFYPTLSTNTWWKVSPFEMIYSKEVLNYSIDYKYINFFIQNPNLLFLLDENLQKYEIPIIVYLGIGESDLNQQLFLNTLNHYNGEFKKGFYFKTFEKAYEDAIIDYETPNKHILKLINYNYLNDYIYTFGVDEEEIKIKDNKFYFREIFIGNVPEHCKNIKYTLDSFDDEYIYLKTLDSNECTKTVYEKRKENGILIRYVLIQNNNYIGPNKEKGFDSYSYNSIFMVKNQDYFTPLSYHIIEIDDFNTNEIKIK
jgi:hypothetical protein